MIVHSFISLICIFHLQIHHTQFIFGYAKLVIFGYTFSFCCLHLHIRFLGFMDALPFRIGPPSTHTHSYFSFNSYHHLVHLYGEKKKPIQHSYNSTTYTITPCTPSTTSSWFPILCCNVLLSLYHLPSIPPHIPHHTHQSSTLFAWTIANVYSRFLFPCLFYPLLPSCVLVS